MTTINNAVFLSDDDEDESFHGSDASSLEEGSSSGDEGNGSSSSRGKFGRKKRSLSEVISDRKVEKIYRELLDQVKTELTERKCTVSENDYMLEFQRKSVGDGRKNTSLGELLHYIDLGVSKVYGSPVKFDISRYKRMSRSMSGDLEQDTKMLIERALGRVDEKNTRYVDKKVRYAGETFTIRERAGLDSSLSEKEAKRSRKSAGSADQGNNHTGGMAALDEMISQISKDVTINSIQKSQSDWYEFRQMAGLESQLEKQRKHGYISKAAFLQKTDWKMHEKELELRKKIGNSASSGGSNRQF